MSEDILTLTDSYWEILKSLSDEVKLRLVSKLIASVTDKTCAETSHTDKMLDKFFGAWDDGRSAEEIICSIKEHSTNRPPVKL